MDAFLMNTGQTFQAGIPTIADFGLAGQALKPGPVVGDACDESWITIPGACTTTSKKEVKTLATVQQILRLLILTRSSNIWECKTECAAITSITEAWLEPTTELSPRIWTA